jgi:hypothetical protein
VRETVRSERRGGLSRDRHGVGQWKGSLRGVPLPLVPGLENNFPLVFNEGGAKSEPDDRNHQIYEEFSDLYKSIYSHVHDRFKSLPSLLRRTNS